VVTRPVEEQTVIKIHLSKDLESFIIDPVRGGRFSSVHEAMDEAACLLLEQSPPASTPKPGKKDWRARPAAREHNPLSPDELNRRLLASGLVTQLPDPSQDIDDEPPIVIEGEPLADTIIRERR
jgi:hypothetical protein